MHTTILPDYETLCDVAADLLIETVRMKPDSLICLASGDTPRGVCAALVEAAASGVADFSRCMFVGLDEWVGMDEQDEGSCSHFLWQNLFFPLALRPEQVYCMNAKSPDLQGECDRMNTFIAQRGPLDAMLVGVGLNGHLGMNEPGTPFDSVAHVSDLHETTKTVGQKYFQRATPLSQGLTLGLKHFAEARLPIFMASGSKKAPVVARALYEPVTTDCPASLLQTLPHCHVLLDEAAAPAR